MSRKIIKELQATSTKERAKSNSLFFKTGKGQYGEGDIFLGVTVPDIRKVCRRHLDASFKEIESLLVSKYHEVRLCGVLILVELTKYSDEKRHKKIVSFYLKNKKGVNNWDLVDLSAPHIVGSYIYNYKQSAEILYTYAKSNDLWERRISILSTFWFIKNDSFKDTLKISEILLRDKQDLIHKAVGWMLREVGKRNLEVEEKFLKKHYKVMPRTMLRYAIEKFPETKRKKYIKGTI